MLEIALDYGFHNVETFSRAFKRVFGVKPYTWRLYGSLDSDCMLASITIDEHDEDT